MALFRWRLPERAVAQPRLLASIDRDSHAILGISVPLRSALRAQFQKYVEEGLSVRAATVQTNLTRLRGRSLRGQRLTMDAPFGSWGTQTLIAGLTHGGLIAPWVINGAPLMRVDMHCRAVNEWSGLCSLRARGAGARYRTRHYDHTGHPRNPSQQDAAAMLKAHGCWFFFLPPIRAGPEPD